MHLFRRLPVDVLAVLREFPLNKKFIKSQRLWGLRFLLFMNPGHIIRYYDLWLINGFINYMVQEVMEEVHRSVP